MQDDEAPRRRGRPKSLDRERLVDIAMRAYWEAGPQGVSVNALCQMAGISKPSLYREFGGEDGLMRAALEAYAASVLDRVVGLLDGPGSFAERLDAMASFFAEDPVFAHGCLFTKLRAAKPLAGDDTRALVVAIEADTRAAFAAFLQSARDGGDWAGCVPVALGARYLDAQFGLALASRAAGVPVAEVRAVLDLALSVFVARAAS